jgi:hypothetical protein
MTTTAWLGVAFELLLPGSEHVVNFAGIKMAGNSGDILFL